METDKIKSTFEKQLGEKVISIHKFENVTNNTVYKVHTETKPYIFKVYRNREWPEDGKLEFIYKKLDEYHIPHAKLSVFSRTDVNFPCGYSIEEYLPGSTADRLPLSKEETIELFRKLADVVSQYHRIKLVPYYGYIGNGTTGIWTTFSEFMFDVLIDNKNTLISNGFIDPNDFETIAKKIRERLEQYDNLPPVLNHGDLSTKNIMVDKNNITLIDWDDAHALPWIADLARLTLWMKLYFSEPDAAEYKNAFISNYQIQYDKDLFSEYEDILHIWYCLDFLTFFVSGEMCEKVKALLQMCRMKCGI